MRQKDRFTKRQWETAIMVLVQSQRVIKWVKAEAKAYGVDLNTPEGQKFYERAARAQAESIIK
jgi:hypothetical protein